MSIHRASSPYRTSSRAPSPYRPTDIPYEAFQSLPTGPAQVGPGAVTYTASAGPGGRIYHLFKAVAASYPTPNGVISGIQWVPAGTTTALPPTAIPPSDRFGFNHKEDLRSTHDWEREDEKRRKREEKEARRHRELHTRNNSDYELQLARDRDSQVSTKRERRKSFIGVAGPSASVPFPQPTVPPGYPQASPYHGYGNSIAGYASSGGHGRSASAAGVYDISKQMSDLELKGERERKVSMGHSRKYGVNQSPYERPRTVSGGFTANPHPPPPGAYSPYSQPKSMYSSASPNVHSGEFPQTYGTASSTGYPASNLSRSPGHATTTFGQPHGGYPPSHVLYEPSNQSRPRAPSRPASRAASRGPSPNPGPMSRSASPYGRSPHVPVSNIPGEPQQLPAPEGFSRPINGANSFAPFEPLKVLDMEEAYGPTLKLPKMPQVLTTHDVRIEDWKRCMQDLTRTWLGQLPVPRMGPDGSPRRSKIAQDLIELWNTSFFLPRGVELVLFKGKDRRTRSHSGLVHPYSYEDDDLDSSTTDSSEFEKSAFGSYDRQGDRSKRHVDKKNRRKEKRRRAKLHSVFVACVRRSYSTGVSPQGFAAPMPGGTSGYPPIAYGTPQMGYAPPAATYVSPYNPAMGIPTTRSRGSGGGY